MIQYLHSILSITASHGVFFVAFAGIGLLINHVFRINEEFGFDSLFLSFWSGFGATLFFLIAWNFFLPIDSTTFYLVLGIGILGFFLEKRNILKLIRRHPGINLVYSLFLVLAFDLWLASMSYVNPDSWDDGLYHIQAVKWANAYPVIKGIANLHGPLGFNNTSFLYFALTNSSPLSVEGFYIANSLLVSVLLAQILLCVLRFYLTELRSEASDIFFLTLIAPLALAIIRNEITSYSTDLPATLVLLVTVAHLYSGLSSVQANRPVFLRDDFVRVTILFAAVVSLKTSIALFSVMVLPLMFLLWVLGPARPDTRAVYRMVVSTGTIVGGCAIVWLTRGIVMSGYPLFPATFAPLPVDWKTPEIHAVAEMANIAYTEREFSWSIGHEWISHVVYNAPYAILVPTLLTLAGGVLYLLRWRKRADRVTETRCSNLSWWLSIPLVVSILFWLIMAPATRYATPLFWSLAALSLAQLYWIYEDAFTVTRLKRMVWLSMFFGFSPMILDPLLDCLRTGRNPVLYLTHTLGPSLEPDFRPAHLEHKPDTFVFKTRSGLQLNVPRRHADDTNKCWNAELPCTSNPSPNLMLRVPGNLAQGFKVKGGWKMIDWPYYWRDTFLNDFFLRYGYKIPLNESKNKCDTKIHS